ncbi:uncharacterized protein A4U43_C01F24670 [Asparagus officinalis]|uniref:Uncharacterized protein n=1 Tax=Asparagus officinalis TaxID=4686 RepID=A0A5P1FS51_ASPOF|nr:uncharacterized protein A4U43_C01F24670 [Asparagus officinalis]
MLFRTSHAAPPSYILWNLALMISCHPQRGRRLLHLQILSKLLTDMHLVYFYFAILMFGDLSSNEGSTFDQVGIISEVVSIIREFTKPFFEDEESYSRPPANHGLNLMMTFLVAQYLVEDERVSRHPILLVATTDSSEGLQPSVRRCFSHEIAISPLTEAQRADMLSYSLEGVSKLKHENIRDNLIKDVIGQTSGFMPRDINGLVADASANFVHRILNDKGIVLH